MSAPVPSTPTRRRVDVYFVLYLVALVLLLPDWAPPESPFRSGPLASLRLEFQPERVRLQQLVRRDTSGLTMQVQVDSMNVIRYVGDVNDLQVSARIEDIATGQVITVQPGDNETSLFSVEAQADRRAILFTWHPEQLPPANRTFRVTLTGSGSPQSTSAEGMPAGLRVSGTTQFVLATVVQNEGPVEVTTVYRTDTLTLFRDNGTTLNGGSMGNFWLSARYERILQLSTRDWTNRIFISGADTKKDLLGLPRIRVFGDIPGEVERTIPTDINAIDLRGKAPRSGTVTIEVTAVRRGGDTTRTSFVVQSVPLLPVTLPEVMYPGMDYNIGTNLPELPEARAVVREGTAIRAESQGTVLRFTPATSDTGKMLTFERLIGGVREGAAIPVRVRSFPAPEIVDVKDNGKGQIKRVIVKFYGDKERNRPMLAILEGNVTNVKKLYGNLRAADPNERPTTRWIEEFEIERKEPGRAFSFKVQARDARGLASRVWTED